MNNNLTKGPILRELIVLAMPLILINLINMAFNFTDMYWVGKISTEALSALGTAGLFVWLSASIGMLASIGIQVLISQAIGSGNNHEVDVIGSNGLRLSLIISIVYGVFVLIFAAKLIALFDIGDETTINYANHYLRVISLGLIFNTFNASLSAVLNAMGRTAEVSKITVTGVVLNIIFDPLFIFVFDLKIAGAALATTMTMFFITVLLAIRIMKTTDIFNPKTEIKKDIMKKIARISLPSAIQNIAFTFVAMIVSVFILDYGVDAIAAQKIGQNVESFSWMISIGITTAVGVFVGQNYGANKPERIKEGFIKITLFMTGYGILLMIAIIIFAKDIMLFFSSDQNVIEIGVTYLLILSIAQPFAIYEGVATGFFNGLSLTKIPAFFSISGNVGRVLLVILFSSLIGLNGIWIAISISGIYKGLGVLITSIYYIKTEKYVNFKHV